MWLKNWQVTCLGAKKALRTRSHHDGRCEGSIARRSGAGVNRSLLREIGEAIVRLNQEKGYTFCMIEHDMDFIGRLCDPVIVMAEGAVLAQAQPKK